MRAAYSVLITLSLALGAAPGCLIESPGLAVRDCDDGECPGEFVCVEKRCVPPVVDLDAGPIVDVPVIEVDWDDLDYGQRARVFIDNATVTTAIVGVPVALRINGSHPAFSDVEAGAIAFYSDDGDLLAHEFETVNAVNARLWVRTDFIPASTEIDVGFWMYFDGGPGNPEAVREVWANHVAAWHLDEPLVDDPIRYPDSVGDLSAQEGNVVANGDPQAVGGVMAGSGLRLNPPVANGDPPHRHYLTISRAAEYHARTGPRTYSLWVLRDVDHTDASILLSKDDRTEPCFGPFIKLLGDQKLRAGYRTGDCIDGEGNDVFIDSLEVFPHSGYHLVSLVVEGTTLRFNIDGVPQGQVVLAGPDLGSQEDALFTIGGNEDGSSRWRGDIDEIRVASFAVTDDELAFRAASELLGIPISDTIEPRPELP